MSKKNETEMVVVEEKDVATLFGGVSGLDEMLQENMEGVEVRLPSIKINHSDPGLFTSSSDIVMGKEFWGIIFAPPARNNAFWAESYAKNPGQPPTCSSVNGKTPQDSPGKQFSNCKNCPRNQFGTAINEDGSAGDGKACKNMQTLFVYPNVKGLDIMKLGKPHTMSLPPTSLTIYGDFAARLSSQNIPFQGIWTKFTLTKHTSKSGQTSQKLVLSEYADNGKMAPVAPTMEEINAFFAYLRDTYIPAWDTIMRGTPDQEIKEMMGDAAPETEGFDHSAPVNSNPEDDNEGVPFD